MVLSASSAIADHDTSITDAVIVGAPTVHREVVVHIEDSIKVMYDNVIHVRIEEPNIASIGDEVSLIISDKHIIIG